MRTEVWVSGVVFLCLVLGGCVGQGTYAELEQKYVERGTSLARANSLMDEQYEKINFLTVDLRAKERLLQKREEELALASTVRDRVDEEWKNQLSRTIHDLSKDLSNVFSPEEGVSFDQKTGALVLEGEVFFDSGSDKVKKSVKKTLLKLARLLNTKQGKIQIVGHTDSDPVRKAIGKFPYGNIQLSGARAMNVLLVLEKEGGVSAKRMSFAGCGPHQPRADNKTKAGKRKNRRVEIMVQGLTE
ncbi:MAG: OmpA/MotB family protein [Planctomycetota bacterium]|jgi:flagellar motor protein MotB